MAPEEDNAAKQDQKTCPSRLSGDAYSMRDWRLIGHFDATVDHAHPLGAGT